MKHSALVVFASVLLFALGSAAAEPAAKAAKHAKGKANVVWPDDQIKWEPGPAPGTKVAKLWGDWEKSGPYGVLIKFDAGVMHPLHFHTQTLKTVILSGTFVFTPEGGTETKLGPGSYLVQAGGQNHISGCTKDAECEFFMTSSDKFDMTNVGDAADKK